MHKHYKFISYAEYSKTETQLDEEGNPIEVHVSPYWFSHPNARVNIEKTEVVLSCNHHSDVCTCVTREQALDYIDKNWQKEEIE